MFERDVEIRREREDLDGERRRREEFRRECEGFSRGLRMVSSLFVFFLYFESG